MANNNTRVKRGVVASLCTLAMAATGAVGFSSAAYADPAPTAKDQAASLTIVKSGGTTTDPSTGTRLPDGLDSEHPPVNGATYDFYKADLDMSDPASWVKAEKVVTEFNKTHAIPDNGIEGVSFSKVNSSAATVNGEVKTDLTVGLYIVKETAPGKVDGATENAGQVQNFIVSLPLQAADDATNFNYNPVIYVKATTPGETPTGSTVVTKNGETQADGTVKWTIVASIPKSAGTDKLENPGRTLEVWDELVGLEITGTPSAKVFNALNESSALTLPTPVTTDITTGGKKVTWTFADTSDEAGNAGAVLKDNAGGRVEITLSTKIDTDQGATTVAVKNTGDGTYNGIAGDNTGGEGKTPTGDKFAIITIKAHDAETPATKLAGATFKVFKGDCTDGKPAAGAQEIISANAVVTEGAEGAVKVTVPVPADAAAGVNFCLTEVAPPAGYKASEPTNALFQISGVTADSADKGTDIPYSKSDAIIPRLPVTGANGRILLMAGGAAALMLAGGLYLSSRKREEEQA